LITISGKLSTEFCVPQSSYYEKSKICEDYTSHIKYMLPLVTATETVLNLKVTNKYTDMCELIR